MAIVGTSMLDPPADMVTVADFDLDGKQEYVVGRRTDPQLSVFSNLFSESPRQTTIALDNRPVALSSGDFDGDGSPELAVALIDARLELRTCDLALNFSLARSIALPSVACDLDAQTISGRLTLVVATSLSVHVIALDGRGLIRPKSSESVGAAANRLESLRQRWALESFFAPGMTLREREVVKLALHGLTARQIGAKLFITDRTVETHLAHAYGKLGVRSRFELIARLAEIEPPGRIA